MQSDGSMCVGTYNGIVYRAGATGSWQTKVIPDEYLQYNVQICRVSMQIIWRWVE